MKDVGGDVRGLLQQQQQQQQYMYSVPKSKEYLKVTKDIK